MVLFLVTKQSDQVPDGQTEGLLGSSVSMHYQSEVKGQHSGPTMKTHRSPLGIKLLLVIQTTNLL